MKTSVVEKDAFLVMAIEGRIVRETQAEVRDKLIELISSGAKGIALNIEGVGYMDSAGLGCFASMQKLLSSQNSGVMTVFGASPNIEKMWKLLWLQLAIPIFDEEQAALDHLAENVTFESS